MLKWQFVKKNKSVFIFKLLVFVFVFYSDLPAQNFTWPGSHDYRVLYKVNKTKKQWKTTPVSVSLNLQMLSKQLGMNADFINLSGLRVVGYDSKGHIHSFNKKDSSDDSIYFPFLLDKKNLPDELIVSWRGDMRDVVTIGIYFSKKGKITYSEMSDIPLVGNGDFLSFGRRGVVAPLDGGYNEEVDAADIDDDGHMDLFVGYSGVPEKEGIYYYKNPGPEKKNVLAAGKRIVTNKAKFQFIDWDYDGKNELIMGNMVYNISVDNETILLSQSESLPEYATPNSEYIDWDGDGLRDVLTTKQFPRNSLPSTSLWNPSLPPYTSLGVWMGESAKSVILFCKNVGTNKAPRFAQPIPVKVHGTPIEMYGGLKMSAGDVNGDGLFDLVAGNSFQLMYFKNTGRLTAPKLEQGLLLKTRSGKEPFGIYVRPELTDWDADGDLDILLGNEDGRPTWIENMGQGRLGDEKFLLQKDPVIDCGCLSVPVICDWDNDGDMDLLAGNSSGFVEYFENKGTSTSGFYFNPGKRLKAGEKDIRIQAGNAKSIQGPDEAKYGYTMPDVADWDADGDLDLLLSDIAGEHTLYENIGSKTFPVLDEGKKLKVDWKESAPKPGWVWYKPGLHELITFQRCRPDAVDWDKDGCMDYVALDHEGYLAFYQGFIKDGQKWLKPGLRCFKDKNGNPIRISDMAGKDAGRARIALADWDGDGDLDILHNAHNLFGDKKTLLKEVKNAGWFENVGSQTDPVFAWQGEIIKKDISRTSEHSTSHEVIDFDGDGILDLLLGGEDGRITCYHRAFIEDDLPDLKILKIEKK